MFHRSETLTLTDSEKVLEEKEANWFAASLLMPEKLVRQYWKVTKDLEELSVLFGVSPNAVYFRLKNLSLLQ